MPFFIESNNGTNRKCVYNKRNFCVSLLRKTKKTYYENLNEKSAADKKFIWKNVKPFISDKFSGKDEIHLIENNELVKTGLETAEVLNNFFSNMVQNLDTSRNSNDEPYANCIKDPTLKAILKYRKHPGLFAIRSNCKNKDRCLNANNASQNSDIPIKIVKQNVDIFCGFVCTSFSSSVKT